MEFKDNEAIYLQIATLVCDHILIGTWAAGHKILSVRDLAVDLEVNPNTVMRSYEYLQDQAILYNKRGVGLFVADDAAARIKTLRKQQFVAQYLPDFFKQLYLLEIPMDEIIRQYEVFKQQQTANTSSNENK